jgi:hypothetical protein
MAIVVWRVLPLFEIEGLRTLQPACDLSEAPVEICGLLLDVWHRSRPQGPVGVYDRQNLVKDAPLRLLALFQKPITSLQVPTEVAASLRENNSR